MTGREGAHDLGLDSRYSFTAHLQEGLAAVTSPSRESGEPGLGLLFGREWRAGEGEAMQGRASGSGGRGSLSLIPAELMASSLELGSPIPAELVCCSEASISLFSFFLTVYQGRSGNP